MQGFTTRTDRTSRRTDLSGSSPRYGRPPAGLPAGLPEEATSDILQERQSRIEELWRAGELDAASYFGMRFFHGIESVVKRACAGSGARHAYDLVTKTLRDRTLTRGHAHLAAQVRGTCTPAFREEGWEQRGLGLDARGMAGFVDILEQAARAAGEAASVDPVPLLHGALLGFVRLDLSVRRAKSQEPLGGEPDSANFFSFAELAFWKLDQESESAFWIALARGAVAAQPTYLAVHFLKARTCPRRMVDHGPGDVLNSPAELQRRLADAPAVQSLAQASSWELQALVGENAASGLLGWRG